jgi:hypothetical protein
MFAFEEELGLWFHREAGTGAKGVTLAWGKEENPAGDNSAPVLKGLLMSPNMLTFYVSSEAGRYCAAQ